MYTTQRHANVHVHMNHMEAVGSGVERCVSRKGREREGKNTKGGERGEREMMKTVRNGNYRNG